jgi:UDP-N-acetyl-D-mannosaminuronate dehydrogenase
MKERVLVIGVGEIGKPLLELIREKYEAYGLDIKPVEPIPECEIMHICFPYDGDNFIQQSLRYIAKYRPSLVIINSTVAPGTTRRIAVESRTPVVNSPVRGKHARMKQEMLHYTKFVGALTPEAGERAAQHFANIGMRVKLVRSPETSELTKLTETTYFGLLIAWAQELERYARELGADYDEVISFYEEIPYLPPVKFFPGVIGGHCVLPNIKILKGLFSSGLLDAMEKSNELKRQGLGVKGWAMQTGATPENANAAGSPVRPVAAA